MPNPKQIDQNVMLRLANDRIEMVINRLEHEIINILGSGDPVLSDEELFRLNILGRKIWKMKRELAEKTARLRRMKMVYFKNISRQHNCNITIK